MPSRIKLLGYVTIKGIIRCLTGIHIGGSADSIDKGGIDNPVIKNPVTNEPYIPGSSFRGRMRSIIEKSRGLPLDFLVKDINLHYILKPENPDSQAVCRTFGGFKTKGGTPIPAFLIVRDSLLTGDSRPEYMDGKLPITEAKMETAIDRITSAAHPRTIERVPAGAEFGFELIYKVQSNEHGSFTSDSDNDVREDIKMILQAMEIIEKHDGLGGHSARGSGQVEFVVTGLDAIKIDFSSAFAEGTSLFVLPKVTKESLTDYDRLKNEHVDKITFTEHAAESGSETVGEVQ